MPIEQKIKLPDIYIEEYEYYKSIVLKPDRTVSGQASFTNPRTSATYTTAGTAYDNQGEQGLALLMYNESPPKLIDYIFDDLSYDTVKTDFENVSLNLTQLSDYIIPTSGTATDILITVPDVSLARIFLEIPNEISGAPITVNRNSTSALPLYKDYAMTKPVTRLKPNTYELLYLTTGYYLIQRGGVVPELKLTDETLTNGTLVGLDGSGKVATALSFNEQLLNNSVKAYDQITLDSDRILFIYSDDSNSAYLTALVVNITTKTIGTPFVFNNGDSFGSICKGALIDVDTVMVTYGDTSNSNYGTAQILDISVLTVTGNTPFVFIAGTVSYCKIEKNNTNVSVVIFRDNTDSNYPNALVLTNSSGTISKGTKLRISTTTTAYMDLALINTNKHVVMSENTVYVITVSGTSLTLGGNTGGLGVVLHGGTIEEISTNKAILFYGGTDIYARTISVSGTTPTANTAITISTDATNEGKNNIDKISTDKAVISYGNSKIKILTADGIYLTDSSELNLENTTITQTISVVDSSKVVFAYDDNVSFESIGITISLSNPIIGLPITFTGYTTSDSNIDIDGNNKVAYAEF